MFCTTHKKKKKFPTSHPLADIFFRTDLNQIVLIDISGIRDDSGKEKALKKKWIATEQPKHPEFQIIGIVLAPFAVGESSTDTESGVIVVRGLEARQMLGGLGQVANFS